jgi:hypothetical protein
MLSLTINGIERADYVEFGSLEINSILTRKVDECLFNIVSHPGRAYIPEVGHEVIILDGATKLFGGVIVTLDTVGNAHPSVIHQVTCIDYTRLLDKRLVTETYENMTIDAIIASIKADFFPSGFTINNVVAPILIESVTFNYKPVSKCLEELADLVGYDWYVDYDKDVHFFSKEEVSAPFVLEDSTGTFVKDSLVIRRDNTQIRNTIYIRGGEYLGLNFTSEIIADGSQNYFPLPYRYQEFKATLTGDILNVGIDNIDNPNNYDALYNFQEKILKFRDARKPTIGSALRISGLPYLPVIVKYKSQPAIDATISSEGGDGIYEYLIIDKSINSKEAARQRARAEVDAYADSISEGTFITYQGGLVAGQQLRINSVSRGIDEYFMINRVRTRQRTRTHLEYEVSLMTKRTFDLIDILQRLLLSETKKLVIDPNETVDLVESADEVITIGEVTAGALVHNTLTETMTVDESFVNNGLNFGTIFVAGAQTPSLTKRVFILNGSLLG